MCKLLKELCLSIYRILLKRNISKSKIKVCSKENPRYSSCTIVKDCFEEVLNEILVLLPRLANLEKQEQIKNISYNLGEIVISEQKNRLNK